MSMAGLKLLAIIKQLPIPVDARCKAARLLRLWVRIPPGYGCVSVVNVVCCADRDLCDGPIPHLWESYRVSVCVCVGGVTE